MKLNKKKIFLVFNLAFFSLIMSAYAESKYIVLTDSVNIRKGAGTNYEVYTTSSLGTKYYLNNENLVADESSSCSNGWYEINYNGASGYVCSEYAKIYNEVDNSGKEPSNTCEAELSNKGFPSSYFVPLCELKTKYPNWNFEPINTGLDFNVVVSQENKCGKSYIETNDPNYIDSGCTSIYSATSIWKPASYGALRYYLDPRNFFTERYIFMFETLSYVNALDDIYETAIESVIQNAAFYSYHKNVGHDLKGIIKKSGADLNVSPIFIASRIYQELGSGTSLQGLYSGTYPNYEYYYNFYNWGVTDTCAQKNAIICGLERAKAEKWYGLEAAIKGGVNSISTNYISNGQNTRYLQKFNVSPANPNNIYIHQYMTNIRAPYGEASTAYNSYKNSNSLNSNFTFSIPVYQNMPAYTSLPTSAADNITSDGASNSSPASPTEETPITISPKAIITSSGYKYSGNNITGINLNTSVANLKSSLESISGSNTVTIKDKKGSVVNSGNVGTGFTITIKGATTEEFTALIYGDISGDGEINPLDLLLVQRQLLKAEYQKGVYLTSCDVNRDGNVNSLDLLLVQRHILRVESINQ